MPARNPDQSDIFSLLEAFGFLSGKVANSQADVFQRGETLPSLAPTTSGPVISVTLAGTSSLAATLQELHQFTVTLAGTSSLTGTLTPYQRFTVTLAGGSSLAATAQELQRFTVTLAGTSALTATAQEFHRFTVTLAGTSALTADAVTPGTATGCSLLLENGGGSILLEDGSHLLLEQCVTANTDPAPGPRIQMIPLFSEDEEALATALLFAATRAKRRRRRLTYV